MSKPKVTGNLTELEKEQKKISRRKEIIKIRTEIIEKEMKEISIKINRTKCWFFEKINKIDKPLVRLIKSIKLDMKKERYNRQHRNTKDHKRTL